MSGTPFHAHGDSFERHNALLWLTLGLLARGQGIEALVTRLAQEESALEPAQSHDERLDLALLGIVAVTRRIRSHVDALEHAPSSAQALDPRPPARVRDWLR